MVAEIDRLTEDVHSDDHDDQAGPTEQPGQKRCESEYMDQEDGHRIGPTDLTTDDRVGK